MANSPIILLVEDYPHDALFVMRTFRHAGVPNQLQVVESAEAAMQYLSGSGPYADRTRHPLPGILIVDVRLPGLSGLDLLKWLQARPELALMPVVIMAGAEKQDDVRQALQLGAAAYLIKGQDMDVLVQMVLNARLDWTNEMLHDHPHAA
jgi:CheY-like chemotaxis protein